MNMKVFLAVILTVLTIERKENTTADASVLPGKSATIRSEKMGMLPIYSVITNRQGESNSSKGFGLLLFLVIFITLVLSGTLIFLLVYGQ